MLTGISKLAHHLTEDNRDEVLARAAGKSKTPIDEFVAELSAGPDGATTIRKLPSRRQTTEPKPEVQLRPYGVPRDAAAPGAV